MVNTKEEVKSVKLADSIKVGLMQNADNKEWYLKIIVDSGNCEHLVFVNDKLFLLQLSKAIRDFLALYRNYRLPQLDAKTAEIAEDATNIMDAMEWAEEHGVLFEDFCECRMDELGLSEAQKTTMMGFIIALLLKCQNHIALIESKTCSAAVDVDMLVSYV